jgi:hypothetical protein
MEWLLFSIEIVSIPAGILRQIIIAPQEDQELVGLLNVPANKVERMKNKSIIRSGSLIPGELKRGESARLMISCPFVPQIHNAVLGRQSSPFRLLLDVLLSLNFKLKLVV